LFVSDAASGATGRIGPASVGEASALIGRHPPAVLWADDRRLVARTPAEGKSPASWWLLDTAGAATDLGRTNAKLPDAFARARDGTLIALMGKSVLRLDRGSSALTSIAQLDGDASLLLPQDLGRPTDRFLTVIRDSKGATKFATVDSMTGRTGASIAAFTADVLDVDFERDAMIFSQADESGLFLRQLSMADGESRDLLVLNSFLGRVDWGRRQLIDYKDGAGTALKAIAILPPDYRPGRRYPTLAWVYGGYTVRSVDDFMSSLSMPGIYNLQLYAARGYVVLVPSMPLDRSGDRHDVYTQIPNGLMPALDRLAELGIADPDRLGVFGQSFGGYSVYALVSQTDRFKAAVAMAGITDLASNYNEFDPTARGYPGIEHEKSDNWQINPWDAPAPPWKDLAIYTRNSPLSYVDRVKTPLVLIHGSADIRGSQTQAEQFFYGLYAQGKTAKLLRYGGESHSLAQSPANVRDIFAETIAWFDRYVKGVPPSPPAGTKR
jgi:dipeptidyl aminopeptidase/acylaminoacyl peptidase